MQKKMEAKEILTHVDHTLLTQTATWEKIRQILDDAMKYDTASACIPGFLCESSGRICRWKTSDLYRHRISERIQHHGSESL